MSTSTPVWPDETLRQQLVTLLRRPEVLARIYDKETSRVRLNGLWFEPGLRKEFTNIIVALLEKLPNLVQGSVLLCPEGILSSFGILPVASIIADRLDRRMAIWREIGDIVTTAPRVYPSSPPLPRDLRCIVLQDVVSRGTTLRKMRPTLVNSGWVVTDYIAVVEIAAGMNEIPDSVRQSGDILASGFRYARLVADSELGG